MWFLCRPLDVTGCLAGLVRVGGGSPEKSLKVKEGLLNWTFGEKVYKRVTCGWEGREFWVTPQRSLAD